MATGVFANTWCCFLANIDDHAASACAISTWGYNGVRPRNEGSNVLTRTSIMASQSSTESEYLLQLKGPWEAEMTPDQKAEAEGVSEGRKIWDFVLKRYSDRIDRVENDMST